MHEIYIVLLDNSVYGLFALSVLKTKDVFKPVLKGNNFRTFVIVERGIMACQPILFSFCWNCRTMNWSLFLQHDEENWLWEVVPQKSIYITITLYWYNLHLEYGVFKLFFSSVLRSSVKVKYVQRFISRAENTLLMIVFFLLWKHVVTLWGNKVCDPYQMLDMIFLANEIFEN